jgi:hypothetical protein
MKYRRVAIRQFGDQVVLVVEDDLTAPRGGQALVRRGVLRREYPPRPVSARPEGAIYSRVRMVGVVGARRSWW